MAAIASVVQFSNALAQSCFCFIDISKVKYDNKKYGMYVCFQIAVTLNCVLRFKSIPIPIDTFS